MTDLPLLSIAALVALLILAAINLAGRHRDVPAADPSPGSRPHTHFRYSAWRGTPAERRCWLCGEELDWRDCCETEVSQPHLRECRTAYPLSARIGG